MDEFNSNITFGKPATRRDTRRMFLTREDVAWLYSLGIRCSPYV
jgi:hypothetical protein